MQSAPKTYFMTDSITKKEELNQTFVLGDQLTKEQISFFGKYGFIHFTNFFTPDQVAKALTAMEEVEKEWIRNNVTKVNGIPIKYGTDENGNTIVQRFAFASLNSPVLHEFLADPRLLALKDFVGNDCRIGEYEKDGLVISHYVNTEESQLTKLGWHTDGMRDVFAGFRLDPMVNVGISLDDSPREKGGLRVLPGTHKQNIYEFFFRKKHFIDNRDDKNEFAIETKAGDLTVHHGRVWHRAALASVKGAASKRRMMYFPIIAGKFKPKSEKSKTPIYHHFQRVVR